MSEPTPPPGFVIDPPPGFVIDSAPKPVGAAMAVRQPTPQVTKAPGERSWSDVPGEALSNLPESAGNFVNALVQPIIHPVDTAKSLGALAEGVYSKIATPRTFTPSGAGKPRFQIVPQTAEQQAQRAQTEAPADAVGQFFADRYGSVEGLKKTLATDPVGAAADAATVLTGGAMAAPRGSAIAGTLSRVGAAVDPLTQTGNVLKLSGKGVEAATSNALGMTTGAGTSSVRAAANAGREGGEIADTFRANMRGQVPVTEIVEQAKSALDMVRQERAQAYKAGMAKVGQDTAVLDFAPVEEAVGKASQVGTYKGQVVETKAQGIAGEIAEVVNNWKSLDPKEFHTAEGFDALKRTIGNIRDSTQYGTPERVAADRVYRAVRAEVAKQAPEYSKIMDAYARASEQIGEATKTFSLREGLTGDTAARKLLSATRNNVQTNYGQREKILNALAEHDPTLPAAIAGQSLNALLPRGIVARGGAMIGAGSLSPIAAALPAFSPRLVGETAYYGGKLAGGAETAANALRINALNARRAGEAAFQAGRFNTLSGQ